jgi:hypothetical protein
MRPARTELARNQRLRGPERFCVNRGRASAFAAVALPELQRQGDAIDVQAFGERLHVTLMDVETSQAEAVRRRLTEELGAGGVAVEAARAITPSLEDVFIARMRTDPSGAPAEVNR